MAALCSLLEWDSAFFGFPIAQVNARRLNMAMPRTIIDWCKDNEVRCLFFLADPCSMETAALTSELGLQMVDVRVELASRVRRMEAVHLPEFELRIAQPTDIPALMAIAREAHQDSRFFFDSHFSTSKSKELFSTWLAADCAGRADVVFTVSKPHREGVGYISCKLVPEFREGSISLFGVASHFRGRGLGKALLAEALKWFASRNAGKLSVVTQARNIGAQRLYQAAGFRTESVGIWYHRWF